MTATPGVPAVPVKVHGTSRLAFGATTAALVTLASGGTAVLVAHATHGVSTPTSLPPGGLPADPLGGDGLVVGRAPGATPPAPPATETDPTERALHDALSARRQPGRRTLTAPLVPLGPVIPEQQKPPAPAPVDEVDDPTDQLPPRAARLSVSHGKARGHEGRHAHPRPHGKGRHAR